MQARLVELCAVVVAMFRSSDQLIPGNSDRIRSEEVENQRLGISPMEFAFLMLGMSLALMLSGSATFIIGFILMPWVIGMATFLFFCGIVAYMSALGWSAISKIPENGSFW